MGADLYDTLIAHALVDSNNLGNNGTEATLSRLMLGLSWSVASINIGPDAEPDSAGELTKNCGICFSPRAVPRTLPWSGTLVGQPTSALIPWVREWEPAAAVVGALVINAVINSRSVLIDEAEPVGSTLASNLAVFEYFRDHIADKRVAVIGHYPHLQPFPECRAWHCIERNPQEGDLPDTAAETILPLADWVFITASTIANKTLPRLLTLAADAKVVLMGPSLPWMSQWKDFGVNYLAGVKIKNPQTLWQVCAEGGGTRLFESACEYRVLEIN